MIIPLTIEDFLRRGAQVYGSRLAVVDEPGAPGGSLGALTYAEFASMAKGLAVRLDELGVGLGARVAVLSPNSARFLCALFGVSAYGRVLVPINYRLNEDEIRYIVEHSGAGVLLVDPELEDKTAGLDVKHRFLLGHGSDNALFGGQGEPIGRVTEENATASINYTSGTTARPKGVELSHRGLWLNAVAFGWHMGVNDADVYLHTLPTFHCNGWGVPYAATGTGVRQIVLRKVDGEEILRRIETEGVTLLCGAPAVAAAILDAATARRAGGRDVPGGDRRVRMVVAGAPPPTRLIERMETELGWEFIQIYGLTETSPLLTVNRSRWEWDDLDGRGRAQRLARAGVPAIGVQLTTGTDGEVLARSNHVFTGYWNQPDESSKAIPDGWFRTGDGGMLDGAYLTIADRKKDVIISGGENVSSIEVEDTLFLHPAVAEVAVIGVPDERWGETIKALVVSQDDVTEEDLIAFCRERLAHFKCPRSVEFRESLPRTATGKLQKFRLRQPYWEGRERHVS
ncbi:MAG: AMP-binding protein [Actinomycetota bacterium]